MIPGMTVLIAQGTQPILAKGYGVAHLDHDAPARPETVYAVASITKQFTAAAVVKLASEGRLRLDDDISKHVPDLPMVRGAVTLRQLLHHTSGIPESGRLPGRDSSRLDYTREEWLAAMRDIYKDRAPASSPGDGWSYEDVNYSILGFAVEKVSGRSLWEYLREHFFVPLAMSSTDKCDPGVVVKHRATGYVSNAQEPGVFVAPFVSPTIRFGGNGLCSSATDLLKWQRALVDDQVHGIRFATMTQTGTLNDGRRIDYGWGLVVWPLGSERIVFHTGGMPGFNSFLAYLPGNDVTIVLLANSNFEILRIGMEMARLARGLSPPRNAAVSREELERYAGTYASGAIKAVVVEKDGRLEARVTGSDSFRFLFPVRLLKQAAGEFVVGLEPESRATFDLEGGRATMLRLRFGGRIVELAREVVAPPPGS